MMRIDYVSKELGFGKDKQEIVVFKWQEGARMIPTYVLFLKPLLGVAADVTSHTCSADF